MTVPQAALIVHEQAGGGGFGTPLARDPQRVEEDFADGKISADFARRHYRVVFDEAGKVDAEGTARLRGQSSAR
jgi:N-methylhydantoinase B